MTKDIKRKFNHKNKGFLQMIDSFFNEKKKTPFGLNYFFKDKEGLFYLKLDNTTNISNHLLIHDKTNESQRYLLIKLNESYSHSNANAILIQKHLRRFLFFKRYINKCTDIFKSEINKSAIIIQTYFRRYSSIKKIKTEMLLANIRNNIKLYKEKIYSLIKGNI